jgi:hypothetical protein
LPASFDLLNRIQLCNALLRRIQVVIILAQRNELALIKGFACDWALGAFDLTTTGTAAR